MTVIPFEDPHDTEVVRAACRAELEDYGISIAAASREMGRGVSTTTLSTWLRDEYAGDVPAVTARVARWLETRREARARSIDAAGLHRHADLGVTEEIEAALAYAQSAGDIVLVHGRAGTGKSWALAHYCERRTAAYAVTMTAVTLTPSAMLARVSAAVGAGGRHPSAPEAEAAIVARLQGRGALLAIDEAENLSPLLLDELRCLRDISGCGVALVGRDPLWEKIAAAKRLEPLRGRTRLRIPLGAPAEADIAAIAAGVLGRQPGRDETRLLAACAAGDGGLHALRGTLISAWVIAQRDGGRIEAKHIRLAGEGAC